MSQRDHLRAGGIPVGSPAHRAIKAYRLTDDLDLGTARGELDAALDRLAACQQVAPALTPDQARQAALDSLTSGKRPTEKVLAALTAGNDYAKLHKEAIGLLAGEFTDLTRQYQPTIWEAFREQLFTPAVAELTRVVQRTPPGATPAALYAARDDQGAAMLRDAETHAAAIHRCWEWRAIIVDNNYSTSSVMFMRYQREHHRPERRIDLTASGDWTSPLDTAKPQSLAEMLKCIRLGIDLWMPTRKEADAHTREVREWYLYDDDRAPALTEQQRAQWKKHNGPQQLKTRRANRRIYGDRIPVA